MRGMLVVVLVGCGTAAPVSEGSAERSALSPVAQIEQLRAEVDAAVDRIEALERQQKEQAQALAAVGLRFGKGEDGAPCLAVVHADGSWGCEDEAIYGHNIDWTHESGGVSQSDDWERQRARLQQQLCDPCMST